MALQLTTQQKIEVLKLTKKLLGPNGEHWIQGTWFGKRLGPGAKRYGERTDGTNVGFQREEIVRLSWEARRLLKPSYDRVSPREADCWCVLGAMEEAAYQLGYKNVRREGRVVGAATSLRDWVRRRQHEDVDGFNDNAASFKDVSRALDARLRELRAEAKQ